MTPPPDLADWAALDAFYQQFVFRGRTVGPKAPPQTFVALEFLNYLISLLHDSRQISWIREAEEEKELLKILLKAKRQLEANEPAKAAMRIEKFLKKVKEESCQDFRCRKEKALTSEAYALLFFQRQVLSGAPSAALTRARR